MGKIITIHDTGCTDVRLFDHNGKLVFTEDVSQLEQMIREDMLKNVMERDEEAEDVKTIDDLEKYGWYYVEDHTGARPCYILYSSNPANDPECIGTVYNIIDIAVQQYKSLSAFEDEAICDYSDISEQAMRSVYEAATGRQFETDNDCQAINDIREDLCQRFHGCYPAWVSDAETGDDIPCFKDECEYRCGKCPMISWHDFPDFNPEDPADPDSCADALIRVLKCNADYTPTEEDRCDAKRIILCYNK